MYFWHNGRSFERPNGLYLGALEIREEWYNLVKRILCCR